jgi:hypothetical protein
MKLRIPAPANKEWVKRFKSKPMLGRTKTYWRRLLECYAEDDLLSTIHDICGPESIVDKEKTLRNDEIKRLRALKNAKKQLNRSIATLDQVVLAWETVYSLGYGMFMATPAEIRIGSSGQKPTIDFDDLLMELRRYARALENHLAVVEVRRKSMKELNRNLGLAAVARVFMLCTKEPYWREFSDIVNAGYEAHGDRVRTLTAEAAQRLWSRYIRTTTVPLPVRR